MTLQHRTMQPGGDREVANILDRVRRPVVDLQNRMDFWCRALGATKLQLYRAVAKVGTDPSDVQQFLNGTGGSTRLRA
jgi:Protein of unknown function (DUF3606)